MTRVRAVAFLAVAVAAVSVFGCKPDYPSCRKDTHCHEGEYCVNNLCQQCRDNGDCPEGQECASGACREIPDYCNGSTDCAQGQICRDNRCGPCLQADDCEAGLVCLDGLCQKAECESSDDCPAGLSCVNYRCAVDSSAASGLGAGDCVLEPIYFEFDSSELGGEMRRVVENNYNCLVKRGGRVTLEGHCDSAGTTEYNMALGERRARMVHKVLETLGFEPSSMRVVSKGEEEATGVGEEGRAKDRRVDLE